MLQTRKKYAGGLSPGKYFLRSMQQNLPKRHVYILVKTSSLLYLVQDRAVLEVRIQIFQGDLCDVVQCLVGEERLV